MLSSASKSSNQEISKMAAYASTILPRTLKLANTSIEGTRRYPPSTLEISSVRRGGFERTQNKPILCKIFTLDGIQKGIYVDPSTTVDEAISEFVERIHIKQKDGFAVCEATLGKFPMKIFIDFSSGKERQLGGGEIMCDVMATWELGSKRGLASEGVNRNDLRFLYKKKIWEEPHLEITDGVAFELLYHQVSDWT